MIRKYLHKKKKLMCRAHQLSVIFVLAINELEPQESLIRLFSAPFLLRVHLFYTIKRTVVQEGLQITGRKDVYG